MRNPLAPVLAAIRVWIPATWNVHCERTDTWIDDREPTTVFWVFVFAPNRGGDQLVGAFRADNTDAVQTQAEAWIAMVASLAEVGAPLCRDCVDRYESANAYEAVKLATHTDHVLCDDCYDRASERAHEDLCSDYYGGSGPSDQDRSEAARDAGRRTS